MSLYPRPTTGQTLRAMGQGLWASVRTVVGAGTAVFGLLGVGIVALTSGWNAAAIVAAVAVVVAVVVVIAWRRAEYGRLDAQAAHAAFVERARLGGYAEWENGVQGIVSWGRGGDGGDATNYGTGGARGGNGGPGAWPGGAGGNGGRGRDYGGDREA